MKRTYVEVECDYCQSVEHFSPGFVNEQAREHGWVITRNGKHYCQKSCKENSNAE